MNSLVAQQHRLRAAIVEAAPTEGLLRGRDHLLRIYRHAYAARLTGALRDNYGCLPRAMGDAAFDALAQAYLAAHPSHQPSIRWFGDRLAEFMAEHDDLVPHPAFVDLARMEWALRGAFDAPDAAPLAMETLASLPADQWPTLVLSLHPSAQLLQMQWGVEPAYRALQEAGEDEEPDLPEPEAGAHVLLVWRRDLETRWRSVPDALEASLLPALIAGEPFAGLCERAAESVGEAQAAARVVGLLQHWVVEGLLASD